MSKPEYEYLEEDSSTWRFHEPPAFPNDFQKGLVEIAGLNRHGKPNLRLVWGGTAISDKNEKHSLKYLAGFTKQEVQGYKFLQDGEWRFEDDLAKVPEDAMLVAPSLSDPEPLGLLRWVIEKWTAPEELERMHRFQNRYLPGETEAVLREFPREGVYDTYFIVENRNEGFRHVDKDVLEFIRMKWNYEKKPFEERLADEQAVEEAEKQQQEKQEEELWRAVWNFDLRLDKEEKERRAEQWVKHNYASDARGTFM